MGLRSQQDGFTFRVERVPQGWRQYNHFFGMAPGFIGGSGRGGDGRTLRDPADLSELGGTGTALSAVGASSDRPLRSPEDEHVQGEIFVVRHGQTEWSVSGQHTGRTDLPLTAQGRDEARQVARSLAGIHFECVLSSPLQRARSTCELAGLGERLELDPDLVEWDYGDYEGLTLAQIHARDSGWSVFEDGGPGGESPAQIGARVDRVIARIRRVPGNVALFAHGHVLRVLAVRWIGLPPSYGRHFLLDTATLGILGRHRDAPAIRLWNARGVEPLG
jgi:probable phosphoglycerate mutase